jgi:salicylate 5-hydroxylase small subunit
MKRLLSAEIYLELAALYVDYAAAVDAGDWERWVDCFADECRYIVQPRENHERGLPLATLRLISKDMLRDRAFGVRETLFHDPYYQRHVVSLPRVLGEENGVIKSEANYAVFRTKLGELSTVFNVGRYLDQVIRTPQGLRLSERLCVYDSEMIPNAIIYPL